MTTTSGSTDFSMTRNDIIKSALRKLGVYDAADDAIEPEDLATASSGLNVMLKEWQGEEIGLWLNQEFTLFMEKTTQRYSLGPTGDKAVPSKSLTSTALSVAGASSDTSLDVDSTSGMTAADVIGVLLDDNTIHWDTIASVTDSDTVVLTTGLTGAAAIDNAVYSYTSTDIISRPIEITECRYRIDSRDIPISPISRDEYMNLASKSTAGTVTQIYFDPQIDNADLYVWPTASSEADRIVGTIRRTIQDFDAASNTGDYPPEWQRAVIWNLADEIQDEFSVDTKTSERIERKASKHLKIAKKFDRNDAPVRIVFNPRRSRANRR